MKKHRVVENGEVITDTDNLETANKVYGVIAASIMQNGNPGVHSVEIRNRKEDGSYDFIEIARTNGNFNPDRGEVIADTPKDDE